MIKRQVRASLRRRRGSFGTPRRVRLPCCGLQATAESAGVEVGESFLSRWPEGWEVSLPSRDDTLESALCAPNSGGPDCAHLLEAQDVAPVAVSDPQGEIRGAAWGRQVHARLRNERGRGHGVQAEGVPETDANELRCGELLAKRGGVQPAIGAVKRPLPEGAEAARGDSGWRWRWRVLQQAHLLMCNLVVTAAT